MSDDENSDLKNLKDKSPSRRDFLKWSSQGLLIAWAASQWGCSMRSSLGPMPSAAILYASRYGATLEVSEWIADGMKGSALLYPIERSDIHQILRNHDAIIIGSGIWNEKPHPRFKAILEIPKVAERTVGAFVVCGTRPQDKGGRDRIKKYLVELYEPLGREPTYQAHFGGRLKVNKLSKEDRRSLEIFYRKVLKQNLKDWDRMNRREVEAFAAELSST